MQKIASFCRPHFVCHPMLSLTDDHAETCKQSGGTGGGRMTCEGDPGTDGRIASHVSCPTQPLGCFLVLDE